MNTTITNATGVDSAALCRAMRDAFSDYAIPLNLSLASFNFMMKQRGLDRGASRIATVDGQIAAIWLVSIRGGRSYLISSGTVPKFRGRGLATAIAKASLASLRSAGIGTFQTEVLVENTTAAGLYFKLGMHTHRDLSCYAITGPKPGTPGKPQISEIGWSDIAQETEALQDWLPSWQNSNDSIKAVADAVRCFCVKDDNRLNGYAVLVPNSGSLLQIGVHPDARRQGIGTSLINHAIAAAPNGQLRLVNVDASDDGFAQFVQSLPATQTQGQFALAMAL